MRNLRTNWANPGKSSTAAVPQKVVSDFCGLAVVEDLPGFAKLYPHS
jgi:hypothetical protein